MASVLVDNFVDSLDAIVFLIKSGNVQIVSTERTYTLDSVFYCFSKKELNAINITELTPADAQAIYETIPGDIRHMREVVELSDKSIFEVIDTNVSLGNIRTRFKRVLADLNARDQEAHDLLIMMSYVNECRTVVSYDMVYLFLDRRHRKYEDVLPVVDHLHELVREYDGALADEYQDYFIARSSAVANAVMEVCQPEAFKRVFVRFHDTMSPVVIPNYDVYRRYGYDHKFASRAFNDVREGRRFYDRLVRNTNNPWDWQHGALYFADKKQFSEAFRWIDTAINMSGSRIFSIRNSHAKILFDANIRFATPGNAEVRGNLDKSMDTLRACYSDDRRKAFHATRFAEQAIEHDNVYRDAKSQEYLKLAQKWLEVQIAENDWNRHLRAVYRRLGRIIV